MLIRGLWTARVGVALSTGFIPTAKSEVRREAATITETARSEMDDETREETEIGWESALPFDQINRVEPRDSDADSILTATERKKLAREHWEMLDRLTTPDRLSA
jgi:hypothetical protein